MGNRAHEKTFFSIPRGQVIFSAKMKFAVALAGAAMLLLISGYSAEGCFMDCSKGSRCEPHPGGGSPSACEKAYGCGFRITKDGYKCCIRCSFGGRGKRIEIQRRDDKPCVVDCTNGSHCEDYIGDEGSNSCQAKYGCGYFLQYNGRRQCCTRCGSGQGK